MQSLSKLYAGAGDLKHTSRYAELHLSVVVLHDQRRLRRNAEERRKKKVSCYLLLTSARLRAWGRPLKLTTDSIPTRPDARTKTFRPYSITRTTLLPTPQRHLYIMTTHYPLVACAISTVWSKLQQFCKVQRYQHCRAAGTRHPLGLCGCRHRHKPTARELQQVRGQVETKSPCEPCFRPCGVCKVLTDVSTVSCCRGDVGVGVT